MGYFKDAQIALEDAREFGTCRATVEASRQIVNIHYRLKDDRVVRTGILSFHCKDEGEFRRRILAAATSIRQGKFQINFILAAELLKDGVKPHALRILTNPDVWQLVGHTSTTDKA